MKRIGRNSFVVLFCLLLAAVLLPARVNADDGDVAINETNFPDENFRNYVATNFDKDGNGVLSDAEKENVTKIDVQGKSISSLAGVQYFTGLKVLFCAMNGLTSLDLSGNTALTTLYCNSTQITSLDLSNNTALTTLLCGSNQLTSLDVSKNTALVNLQCPGNQLTSLDVSKNISLTRLDCYSNQLTSLDMSKNTSLEHLACSDNQLTSLDVSTNSVLTELGCIGNDLTTLDIAGCTALMRLYCYGNPIGELRIRSCPELINVVATGSQATFSDQNYGSYVRYEMGTGSNYHTLCIPLTTRLITLDVEPPVIAEQPETVYTVAGKPVSLSLTVATPRGTTLTYQWYCNGEAISGATKATYLFMAENSMDGDKYYCDVTNPGGTVRSKTIEIRIVTTPKITTQPKAASVKAGKKVTFKIKADGEGLSYQWFYQKPKTSKWVKLAKGTKATYSFTAKKSQNGYKYRCTVTNAAGKATSKAVKLTVK